MFSRDLLSKLWIQVLLFRSLFSEISFLTPFTSNLNLFFSYSPSIIKEKQQHKRPLKVSESLLTRWKSIRISKKVTYIFSWVLKLHAAGTKRKKKVILASSMWTDAVFGNLHLALLLESNLDLLCPPWFTPIKIIKASQAAMKQSNHSTWITVEYFLLLF